MDEYITKPVQPEQLFDMIALVLQGQKAGSPEREPAVPSQAEIVDWQRVLRTLDNDPRRLTTYLDAVVETLPGLLQAVEQAVAAGDGANLQVAARTLMETIRYLGVEGTFQRAFELERLGRDDRLEEARQRFPGFAEDVERIRMDCVAYREA
jgi:HPt (histidine-containing phosphotransfer) domain-containing protein